VTVQATSVASWRRSDFRRHEATASATALAVLLTGYVYWLVVVHQSGSIVAGVAAAAMTAPVAGARISPSGAGVSLALGAGLNELFFGHLVRCGPALPAAFFVAFVAGSALGRRGWLGLSGGLVSVVVQCIFDPNLGAPVIALMAPITLAFFVAGRYVRRRAVMVAALRQSTAELAEQREQTARLAVIADREEITDQLNTLLLQRIKPIDEEARRPSGGREQFATIEQLGRETLDAMRDIVGSLRDAPIEPAPGLADLADVCARVTTARVRLTVDGAVRPLPASVELSACRIVEQLLRLLTDQPSAQVQLRLGFSVGDLTIALSGPATTGVDIGHAQALAGARAALHGGDVDIVDQAGQCRARIRLPLMSTSV